jgi:hypothetical protein
MHARLMKTALVAAVAVSGLGASCFSDFRKTDVLESVCQGSIVGLGTEGYSLAVEVLLGG